VFAHHIAYRHENGDIEEFLGSGLTLSSARQNSVYAAMAAVSIRQETFALARVINGLATSKSTSRKGTDGKLETRRYLAALL
jgi:hypothetical protein